MHFDDRGFDSSNSISNSYGSVRISTGIEYDTVISEANFLYLVGLIAIFLAIFNTIPIPALDGGRFVFLAIEGIIKKPLPDKVIQILVVSSFVALIPLFIWVTINDITRIF